MMKFQVEKASEWGYKAEIEINTMEKLMIFITNNGKVIIHPDESIIIYDDYIE